ncbi:hypothetical protein GCM10010274_40740 [Streptomyces lavendofoliae]|uniref:Uncharacterized protein n=1 Tax=Streptomyces lavendofoliae TaxID=67314 RepID=A0A918M540_9ACTN|nr:hypothetical protein GCM10010274_40740 [Streptomyces lavendofoliae]
MAEFMQGSGREHPLGRERKEGEIIPLAGGKRALPHRRNAEPAGGSGWKQWCGWRGDGAGGSGRRAAVRAPLSAENARRRGGAAAAAVVVAATLTVVSVAGEVGLRSGCTASGAPRTGAPRPVGACRGWTRCRPDSGREGSGRSAVREGLTGSGTPHNFMA